jgi:peptide-methionine (S)-S-oxide reductase
VKVSKVKLDWLKVKSVFNWFSLLKEKTNMLHCATFGAGCFWSIETLFAGQQGVTSTSVGYMGGHTASVTYEQICTDTTGHVEVVDLKFDDHVISYQDLLQLFWANHNPTTPNRQGPDHGSQYRSVVFYHTEIQRRQALGIRQQLDRSRIYSAPIVTTIEAAKRYHKAEEYHQKYLQKLEMSRL